MGGSGDKGENGGSAQASQGAPENAGGNEVEGDKEMGAAPTPAPAAPAPTATTTTN